MAQTIGSIDLASLKNLRDDLTQYFWFEPNASATYGAGAHITLVPDTTFISNPTGQNILMNTDGFSIRNGLLPMMTLDNNSLNFNVVDTTAGTYKKTATFGANGAQIGTDDDVHIEIDKDSFIIKDNLGNEFAHIGSPSGSQVTDTFVYNIDTYFLLTFTPVDEPVVLLNGNSLVDGTDYTISNRNLHVTTSLQKGDVIEVTYTSSNQKKYYIFGTSVGNPGVYSFSEGSMVSATGKYGAHAEGNHTSASGGYGAHAEGHYTEAIGDFSHAQNFHTIAGYNTQTVIGAYNDNKPYSLFEIGNGEDSEHRSNALTVDWNGNVDASGSIVTDSNFNQEYSVTVSSLAGSTYLGQAIDLGAVGLKHPIFTGYDITGSGTARIHTLGHYLYKENGHWKAYIKMRNDNTSAINNFTVKAYITWI